MKFEYTINGMTLNRDEVAQVHYFYEASITAEYVMENYGITDEDKALRIGYAARELMLYKDYDEVEAIEAIMEEGEYNYDEN